MVNYRRLKIPGGTYFFTVTLRDRESKLLTEYIQPLTNAMRQVRAKLPFKTIALVVLPDHVHAMWELPEGDDNYSYRWMKIKSNFTRALIKKGVVINKNNLNEYNLWQRRFWEHTIRNDKDYENHANYIHYNPVKHRLVKRVRDWPYSTFHRYVREDILPLNWCDDMPVNDPTFGTGEE